MSVEEKSFKAMCIAVARKEHKSIAEIEEEWCLSDIAFMCASYKEEGDEMERINRDIQASYSK